ncbi:hypothetical protein CFH99_01685 [Nocardioides aromaticivorans]|uniref:Peptidase S8/S53 domain-containing protein n=1 Tax=Nocardioides aromaticivorans TaxID=200618 RepID=A0ABX7PEN6_9ACTN|nr:hypothetical protein CFH99_01685 [Nocardioides aromaticivorans]
MIERERPAFPIDFLKDLIRKLRIPGRRDGGSDRFPGPSSENLADDVLRVQVGVIRKAFKAAGLDVAGAPIEGKRRVVDDADVRYLYRPGHILARREDVGRLREFFESEENQKRFRGKLDARETRVPGLVLAVLPSRTDEQDDVLATLVEVEDGGFLERGAATPDHVVYVTPKGYLCPATEPEVPRSRRPWPPPTPYDREITDEKTKIRVTVVDSGLWKDAVGSAESPWLETDDVFAGNEDLEQVIPTKIHEYAGHGTFVAGVISCIAPETRIDVEAALPYGGAVFESDIVDQIQDALEENKPQIISISAGTHTRDNHELLSLVLLAQNNKFDENDDVLIVAAAGNDSSNDPFYPAASAKDYPWVVSVGSVDPDKKVSDFSNFGKDWVSVYARGRNLVNAFPKGTYTCHEPPNKGKVRKFDGLAQWSGTSFSTPIVTGLIAAEMRDNGLTARAAWDVVRQTAITEYDARIGEDIQIVGPLT